MNVDVLMFDMSDAVFDWRTAITKAVKSVDNDANHGIDADVFAQTWRQQSLDKVAAMAKETTPWRPFDQILQTTLDTTLLALEHHSMSQLNRVKLLSAWDNLPAWPGVAAALQRLRQRYFTAPHTVLSLRMAAFSSRAAGINWDAIISCDGLQATKWAPVSYQRALHSVGRSAERVCFVASQPADLRAAGEMGMRTAYVAPQANDHRSPEDKSRYADEFDLVADDFDDLASQLGCA